ncbi:GlxA family transcriptional regulator [Embleya sp. NPDC059237]|uniref:GlxA family transcriptional regulator n=1 Tax=Embleya sp. NPDC059237 TaxID=3346784 RepID=UPI00367BB150
MPVIAVLALDGIPGHQLTAPGLVFGTAARHHPPVAYDLRICTAPGFTATGEPGCFRVEAPWDPAVLKEADTVLIPGHAAFRDEPAPEIVAALRGVAARGGRIGAVGTGTFTLAATGLLDGRRAATARRYTRELARRHPRIEVDPEGEVVADGGFHSAAGVLGGVDLYLDLITLDYGLGVAIETERQLFLQLHAPAEDVDADGPDDAAHSAYTPPGSSLEPTTAWLAANLHHPIALADIAGRAGLGVRSLTRRFRAETGLSPLQYLLRIRIQRAQWLLERTEDPVERIAAQTGLGTPANLRAHFLRATGTTPSVYRAAFRSLVADFTPSQQSQHPNGNPE